MEFIVLAKQFSNSSEIVKEIKKTYPEIVLLRHNNAIEKELLHSSKLIIFLSDSYLLLSKKNIYVKKFFLIYYFFIKMQRHKQIYTNYYCCMSWSRRAPQK